MKFTGERFMPEIENEELATEHMQRYVSVLPLVRGKKVVDIASGEGYGSNILAVEAASVIGVDISTEAVESASKKYVRNNLSYSVGDVAKIPMGDKSVDVIISFETIEHVDEETQKKFLKEVKRILKEDGILVISTPNKELYSDKYNYHNEFHVKEFYKEEFLDFIKSAFKNIELYNQYDEVVNVIENTYSDKAALLFKYADREGKYYIVVASDGNIPKMNQMVTVRTQEEYSRCLDRIIELQKDEEQRNEHIKKLDEEIAKRDSLIQELQSGEEERNEHIKKLDGEIAEKDIHIRQLQQSEEKRNTHINRLDEEIEGLNDSLEEKQREIEELMESERLSKALIATLKENATELRSSISDREQKIMMLQKLIIERDEKITELKVEIEKQKASLAVMENQLESRARSEKEKENRIEELQGKISSQKEEIAILTVQLNELVASCDKLEEKQQREIEKIMESERLSKELGKELIATLKENVAELRSSISDREQKIMTLQKMILERDEKITELKVEIEKQKTSLAVMENQQKSRVQNEKEKESKIEELQGKISSQKDEIDALTAQLNEFVALCDKLQEEKVSLQSACEELSVAQQSNQKVEELRHAYDEICVSRQELQESFDRLCEEKQNIHEYGERVNDEKDRLKEKVSELEQEIRNKQGHIELLLESERELERLKAQENKRFVNRVLPKNSKRRLFVKLAWKCMSHPLKTIKMIFTKGKVKNFFRFLKRDGVVFVDTLIEDNYRGTAVKKQELVVSRVESAKDISEYQSLTFSKQKKPQVSIVIPVYNQFEYTYNCLKSILNNSGEITYEIIIANDCSTDLTTRISEMVKNIKVVTNKENLRFLKNCNNAAKHANGKYILFLNNDTQVQPNWLAPLVELIERDEKIGMVGSKLVYADGTLQEAGGILWKDGSAWNYGNRRNPEEPEFNYVKEVDYISGAAIMIKTDLWKEIGGFDEAFAPAYCEDSDLAFEVRKHGYKVMYQPLSVVVHYEGISNGTDTSSGQKAYQVINQKKFMEKWKEVLETEHFPNAENVFVARDRNRNKPTLLMVDHYAPQYDKDAGSRTVFQYLRLFVKQGYNVKFIGDNYYKHEPYTTVLQQMGVEVLYGSYYANNWETWIKENAEHFDYVFLNRPHISVKYIEFIRKNTKARIIYYGHDLHFLREKRRYELEQDSQALKDSKEWKVKEIALMKYADVAYYPSDVEVKEISKIDAGIKAKAIVAYMFENVIAQPYDFKNRKDIMFVGGFTHKPNVDAVLWFVKDILPMILDKLPDLKFYVIGSNPPESILNLASDNVIVKGFVSDEELEEQYRNCRISVVPLRYGAGIKGKVVEAMRYGMPVVTTSVGAEGIIGAETILCIGNKAKVIARNVVKLYLDKNALQDMSARSYEYIKKNFSMESAWNVIEEDFK